MLSPQRPVDSAWAQEFELIVNSVVRRYDCKVTTNRMMQAGVVSKFHIDEIKRVAKLFCIFEDVVDDLEFESKLTTPDEFPPAESVRHNSIVANMNDGEVMEAIDEAQCISDLRMLLTPYIEVPGLPYTSIFKMQFIHHRSKTEIVFNIHPTTTCGDRVICFIELMAKFVQYALDHDDETIEICRPSMEVLFDEIIRDEKLAQHYDPRRSRTPQLGVV
ncbi:hypothetical protein CERSUDRAFT_103616 [Gelatoporia subvermispora B]|uniref:Uncharacterized protein n=1 Tax=Ceriporiopsis subvermispora (strain B) TaxID=914234 RepID=M2PSG9_CERS8|nr:hypothetical protein CERSUDRAFT_103616 [Gelatoporia subvermispora B]